jgi:hypothetical protein
LSESYKIPEYTVWTRHTVLVPNLTVQILNNNFSRVDATSKLSKEDLAPYSY